MVNINGNIVKTDNAYLSIHNTGFINGDAVFETIKVVNGNIVFWEDHYFRLMASMRIMRMEIPMSFTPEFLENEIKSILEANGVSESNSLVKLYINRNDVVQSSSSVDYLICVEVHEDDFYKFNDEPYVVELFKDYYLAPYLLTTINTNNKALNILASIFAKENDYNNCLLLNTNKNVVGGINSNIFIVKGNVIKTPPITDGCKNGIIRKKLIEIIKVAPDLTIEENSVSPFELQKADELFLTNIKSGIQPVSNYRKKKFANTVSKSLLGKLNTEVLN